MIVCSCAVITKDDIRRAIAWMRAADPDTIITPGKVYRALGKRAECGGCIQHFVAIMRETRSTAVAGDVPPELCNLRAPAEATGGLAERPPGDKPPRG